LQIADLMLSGMNFKFSPAAREAFVAYIAARMSQPLFSNARSIRNALDRARLRQANRLMSDLDHDLTADDLMTIEPPDITASRVFKIAEEQARRHCQA
jgi:AAA lid domain